jgi:hypothetical protein
VHEISRTATRNQATDVNLIVRERTIEKSELVDGVEEGSLNSLLHNRIHQRIRIKDADGEWFFNGHIVQVSETSLDRYGRYIEYEILARDRTNLMENRSNTFGRKILNDVKEKTLEDVIEYTLSTIPIESSDITITPEIGTRTLASSLKSEDQVVWEPGQNAQEFLTGYLDALGGGLITRQFDWSGDYRVEVVPNLNDDAVAVPSPQLDFYVDQKMAMEANSDQWMRDIVDVTTDDHDMFANVIVLIGNDPTKPSGPDGQGGNFNVMSFNWKSVFDPSSKLFVGDIRLRGRLMKWCNNIDDLRWASDMLTRRFMYNIPREVTFTSVYTEWARPGIMIRVIGPALIGPMNSVFELESYWIIESMETIINRNSPTDGSDLQAETTYTITEALPRILDP